MESMKNNFFVNSRMVLGGALLGVAIMGLISHQMPYHDVVGAVLGGASVWIAKARHFI